MIHLLVILPVITVLLLGGVALTSSATQQHADSQTVYRPLSTIFSMLVLTAVIGILSAFWWQTGFDGATQQLQLLHASPDWLAESRYSWIPSLNASWYLALDGLSLIMLALVTWLGLMALVLYRRSQLDTDQKTHSQSQSKKHMVYVPCLIVTMVASATTILLAVDLLLMLTAWLVLVFSYYVLWLYVRHQLSSDVLAKDTSPNVFLILTQLAGLTMLVALLILVVFNFNQTQQFGFDYVSLLSTRLPAELSLIVMLCFCAGVLLLLPVIGLHLWQVRIHQLPSYLMLLPLIFFVVAVYMLWRFVLPLFPEMGAMWQDNFRMVAIATQVYAAILAFSHARVTADTQASKPQAFQSTAFLGYVAMFHAGMVLFAIYIGKLLSWQSALLYLVSVLMGVCGLYVIHMMIQSQKQTVAKTLVMSGLTKLSLVFFACIAAAFPFFGVMIAEFQLMVSVFSTHPVQAVCVLVALFLLSVAMGRYVLSLLAINQTMPETVVPQESTHEPVANSYRLEWSMLVIMACVIIKTGLLPQKLLDTSYESLRWIHHVYTKPRKLHGGQVVMVNAQTPVPEVQVNEAKASKKNNKMSNKVNGVTP